MEPVSFLSVLQGVGAAMSVVGFISQASAASSAAKYNAQVAENNAIASRQQAAEAERLQRIQATKQLGLMRANYGASGVQTEGSPLDVLEESASAAEMDALNIRYKGELAARGYGNTAGLEGSKAGSAMTAGVLKAGASLASYGSTLLGGGGGGNPTTYGDTYSLSNPAYG